MNSCCCAEWAPESLRRNDREVLLCCSDGPPRRYSVKLDCKVGRGLLIIPVFGRSVPDDARF